jgi:hypothetical protein
MMSALALLAMAERCPHEKSRAACTIVVFPEDAKPLALCVTCKTTLGRLIDEWDRGELSAKEVYEVFAGLGYSHEDAGNFLTQTLQVAA